MPSFREYQPLDKALRELRIGLVYEDFVQPLVRPVRPGLAEQLDTFRRVSFLNSEAAVVQAMVFPILAEVWTQGYLEETQLWSEPWLEVAELQGEPDFMVTRLTRPGARVFQAPFVAVVEAKEEQFKKGWGQCLAALVAAQQLNATPARPVFGIVTIGVLWQFGKLVDQTLYRDTQAFDALIDLPRTCGAVRYVFEQGKALPVPAA